MTSSEIFERGTFCGTKISKNGRSEAVAWFAKSKKVQMFKFEDMSVKRFTDGGPGAKPPEAGQVFGKKAILTPLDHIFPSV